LSVIAQTGQTERFKSAFFIAVANNN